MATLVSQPSLSGTENSGFSASVAGPAAAAPATVRTIHAATTMRLCARTQRVSVDTSYLRSQRAAAMVGEEGRRVVGRRAALRVRRAAYARGGVYAPPRRGATRPDS